MTIYSQHPNRGKVQILATYEGQAGTTSATVTSVADASLVTPIVDALNRISALATVPVSLRDLRTDRFARYPRTHLAALTDQSARTDLLKGSHSLWYEYVMWLLHGALADLDNALEEVPAPVRTAIEAELETEAGELCDALVEFSEGPTKREAEVRRYWDFEFPFVAFEGGTPALSREMREALDLLEEGITAERRESAVTDLRLLLAAHAQAAGGQARLEVGQLEIFDEPEVMKGYYLVVNAPRPDGRTDDWRIEIGYWEPDDPDEEECTSATGETVLFCELSARPTLSELAAVLNQNSEQLAAWATTPSGERLAGTAFVVSKSFT
ncbi:hypothetical protein [Actinomadura litoris]|uniref:hypothetical protein n=1 Tax=Actinomadura litoris TaxID=2678616 RepID=UPI001FA704D3|nr:hypothetical protein [Actinomadura litoris]